MVAERQEQRIDVLHERAGVAHHGVAQQAQLADKLGPRHPDMLKLTLAIQEAGSRIEEIAKKHPEAAAYTPGSIL